MIASSPKTTLDLSGSTLDGLRVLEDAVVTGVEGEPVVRRRLLEAGFVPGSAVRFVMATPFGDPLVFSLRGTQIALRRSDARHVRIKVESRV